METLHSNIVSDLKLNFCEYNFLLALSLRNHTAMNKMNEKHKNLMSESYNSVSEAVGEKQQDLTMIQKTNAYEDCNSADILSKVIMLEKPSNQRQREQKREGLNVRLLNSLSQDVKHEDGEFRNKRQDRLRQSFAKTGSFVFRDDVSMFTYTDYFAASKGCDSLSKKHFSVDLTWGNFLCC